MKKFITLFTLLFTTITFAQLITHSTVRLDEADHEGYLELENFGQKYMNKLSVMIWLCFGLYGKWSKLKRHLKIILIL